MKRKEKNKTEMEVVHDLLELVFPDQKVNSLEQIKNEDVSKIYKATLPLIGTLIIKLHPALTRVRLYRHVQWVSLLVRDEGIPVPEILHIGNTLIPYSYMIYRRTPGINAESVLKDRFQVWRKIGALAKKINTISAPGYGHVLHWDQKAPNFYATWKEYIQKEITRMDSHMRNLTQFNLEQQELFSNALLKIKEIENWEFKPTIIHGDLVLKNIILLNDNISAIIDWDETLFARAPHYEFVSTLSWISNEEQKAFLEGYGISIEELQKIEKELNLVRLQKYAELMLWYSDIKDMDQLYCMQNKISHILANSEF